MKRRELIALLAASTQSVLPRWAAANVKLSDTPFTLGIASGSPRHDSVVLWTRLHLLDFLGRSKLPNAPINVLWQVADDVGFSRIVQQGQTQAFPELGHSVHIELQNLLADTWYYYRFIQGEHVSSTGRTRTFPAPDTMVNKLRFAYASCQRYETGYFSAYTHMLRENLDAVIF